MYIVFIIQLVILILFCLFCYLKYRNVIKIKTSDQLISDISPGLTKTADNSKKELIFWFYSLEEKKYKKFILDDNMKVSYDSSASVGKLIEDIDKGFYFNFGHQRWERKIYNDDKPHFNETRNNILMQYFQYCYFPANTKVDDISTDADDKLICEEQHNETFIKMNIRDENFIWDENEKLTIDVNTVFPNNIDLAKFTMNRYKEFLNVYYDYKDDESNKEMDMNVYFKKVTANKWILMECENNNDIFDGKMCIAKFQIKARGKKIDDDNNNGDGGGDDDGLIFNEDKLIYRSGMIAATESDTKYTDLRDIQVENLQLNDLYSVSININAIEKRYLFNMNYYLSCEDSLYIIPNVIATSSSDLPFWKINQIIDNRTRELLLKKSQTYLPILENPLQIYNVNTAETLNTDRPFIIYKNNIYYLKENLFYLYLEILKNRKEYNNDEYSNDDNNYNIEYDIANIQILPHIEIIRNYQNEILFYVLLMGSTILDVYAKTEILDKYIDNLSNLFLNNQEEEEYTFKTLIDDFHINKWSCNFGSFFENKNDYTYISMINMYENLDQFITIIRNY